MIELPKHLLPRSKSHQLRALLLSLMTPKVSCMSSTTLSDDVKTLLTMVDANVISLEHDTITIDSKNWPFKNHLNTGNSGILLRFVTALAATQTHTTTLTGDLSCQNRPMEALTKVLTECGASITFHHRHGFAPLSIQGPIKPGVYTMGSNDSQHISALLLALSTLDQPSTIVLTESGEHAFIEMTIQWLRHQGHIIELNPWHTIRIYPQKDKHAILFTPPYDIGLLAPLLAWGMCHRRSLLLPKSKAQHHQPDDAILTLLQQMGAQWIEEEHHWIMHPPETIRPIHANINHCIDMLPTLALLATQCTAGSSNFSGIRVAETKECNRPAVLTAQLRRLNADIEYTDGALIIHPSKLNSNTINHHQDHRMAMMLHVASTLTPTLSRLNMMNASTKVFLILRSYWHASTPMHCHHRFP